MLRIRELNPESPQEIQLVAQRMRQTLIEVLGVEKGTALYSMDWLENRVRWHLNPLEATARVFVGENSRDEIVAHAIARLEQDENGKPFGYFSTLYVEPTSRNQRYASQLIGHIERWLAEMDLCKIVYNTAENHAKLIRLFERHGYQITYRQDEMVQLTKLIGAE